MNGLMLWLGAFVTIVSGVVVQSESMAVGGLVLLWIGSAVMTAKKDNR